MGSIPLAAETSKGLVAQLSSIRHVFEVVSAELGGIVVRLNFIRPDCW